MEIAHPRISVLILTYNRANLVERSIKSVLAQTFTDYELVLVDNGSTDDTLNVLNRYRDLENVRVFSIEKNIGFARGFNFCLDQIQCEWFCTVGDDDAITPNALETLFQVVDDFDPTITAVSSNGWDSATDQASGIGLEADQYLPIGEVVAKCDGDFWGITKSSLIKDKRLNPDIPGMENTLWYKVDAEAKRYYIHKHLITYYTDHSGPRETAKQDADLKVKAKLYKELLTEPFFWEVLQKYNPAQFHQRCLKAMHFLKAVGDHKNSRVYQKMLAKDQPSWKDRLQALVIQLLPSSILTQLFFWKQRSKANG